MDYIEYKDFTIYQSQEQIYFEHVEHGDEYACCIYLDGDGKIRDYDACYVIPEQVGEWLGVAVACLGTGSCPQDSPATPYCEGQVAHFADPRHRCRE